MIPDHDYLENHVSAAFTVMRDLIFD